MTDRLRITGLVARGRHGVYAEERRDGQDFVIDVELRMPLAGLGDDVTRTVHYGELAQRIVAAVERDPVDLIETIAERVAALVLEHETVEEVEVTVHKPHAPIPVPFHDVSATIVRRRG